MNSMVLFFLGGWGRNSERDYVSVMELKSSMDPSGEFCAFSLYDNLLPYLHRAPYTPKIIPVAQVQAK